MEDLEDVFASLAAMTFEEGEGEDDDEFSGYVEIDPDAGLSIEDEVAAFQNRTIDPKPFEAKSLEGRQVCIVDTETDPFAPGVVVKPFTVGFYDGNAYVDWWGDDCVAQFFDYLKSRREQERLAGGKWEPIILAHNGGKFDFHFFLDYLDADQNPLIMGARLVKIHFAGFEFRDSFAIIPEALKNANAKEEIDYSNFTRDKREKHRAEILAYQKTDCLYAYEVVMGFYNLFGDSLTVASASLRMLHSFHGFEQFSGEIVDAKFRQFYYGGRNECFEKGIIRPRHGGKLEMWDKNSMYPDRMKECLHPISRTFEMTRGIDADTDFACILAYNQGALPIRGEDGGLDFTCPYGTFYATIHEINAGLDTGRLQIMRVKHAYKFTHKATFAEFVDFFYNKRLEMKAIGDKLHDGLYKRNMNASYGKFALNPEKFKQWLFTVGEIPQPQRSREHPEGWSCESQAGAMFIWSRPSPRRKGFYNVATAASITGAARADLLRNLSASVRPIYCDTDSILCERFNGDIDPTRLGGWKLEATGTMAAIAGKKLYTLIDERDPKWIEQHNPLKKASKGVRLEADEIIRIAKGETVTYENPVPAFALGKEPAFINRTIRMT